MASRSLRDFSCVTFDCYGTLVDWESGLVKALEPLIARLGPSSAYYSDTTAILQHYATIEARIQEESPSLQYTKVLEDVYQQMANACGVGDAISEQEKAAFGASIGSWEAYPDTLDALHRLKSHFKLVVLSNVDKRSFATTLSRALAGVNFDAIYVAEDIGSYKPDLRNFEYLISRCKSKLDVPKTQILHTAYSLPADLKPAKEVGLAGCLIERYPNIMGGDLDVMRDRVAAEFQFATLRDMADEADRVFSSS